MAQRLRQWCIAVSGIAGSLFLISGRWNDTWLWAYVAVCAAVSLYALASLDDDLARERFHPPEPGADKLSLRVIRLIAAGHIVLGALDVGRWHLTSVHPTLRLVGLIGMAVFSCVVFHAMLSNRFFSSVVRVQKERGHYVVDKGPYAVIRHPGYAGMIPVMPCSALALGSWISFALALVYSALIVRRVLFEDVFLRQYLDGYDAYARRVRYRLIPGVF